MSNTRADGGTLVSQLAAVGFDNCKTILGLGGTFEQAQLRCCVDR